MDRIDRLQTHVDALAQQLHSMAAHTRVVERRLRWWRGLALGMLLVALMGLPLQPGRAQEPDAETPYTDGHDPESRPMSLKGRVQALERAVRLLRGKLVAVTFNAKARELVITRANLRIVNGLGSTACGTEAAPIPDCPNGLGNLLVGYNEERTSPEAMNTRTGSHNVVVGTEQNFSRFGGLVVGRLNEISGDFASVSGGGTNTASGDLAAGSGGNTTTTSGLDAAVSGGSANTASGGAAAVSGGRERQAPGERNWAAGAFFSTHSTRERQAGAPVLRTNALRSRAHDSCPHAGHTSAV